jgi:hypothetical protein
LAAFRVDPMCPPALPFPPISNTRSLRKF